MNEWTCGIVAIILIAVSLSIPRRFVIGAPSRTKGMTRAQAEKWLRDNGYEDQTPEELRRAISEEKRTHNSHHASIAFWSGSETYIDADGNTRRVEDYG